MTLDKIFLAIKIWRRYFY